jgi:uncharacterized protein (DUF342 family)
MDQENGNRQQVLFGSPNDGNLVVSFSENDLEVHADFVPPKSGGQALNTNAIGVILQKISVTYGIRWNDIQNAIEECNLGHRLVKDIIIARGDPPVNEIAEFFEINPALHSATVQNTKGGSRIDYRQWSPFIIVKKDQALAKLRQRVPGKEGKDVHNQPIPFSSIRPEGLSGGENTRTEKNMILSTINGQMIEEKKVLRVQETLVIKGGVDFSTGNIIFPGDVVINGQVSDGFKIYSGGSVTIKQTFDVTECVTHRDLVVTGGIIGRGAGLLKVGGGIKTKFIENCRAAARKAVIVDSEINNASVFTLEHIEMSDKGLILGSDIYAVNGVKAGGIGKKAAKATRIHCGIDFTVQQEKERCNNQLRIIAAKLAKLADLMSAPDIEGEKKAKMEELKNRLEEEQRTISARISDLLSKINTNENAVVEVSGEIVPNTLIEICQIALFLEEPLKKVRIKLDKMGCKLITEPL